MKNRRNSDSITCKIHEVYGYLGPKEDKVYVRVSWNDGPPRDEIRKCWRDKDGELRLGKGIDLSKEEIERIQSLYDVNHPAPVDFDDIFASANGIMHHRDDGHRTVDGFIVLRPRSAKWPN